MKKLVAFLLGIGMLVSCYGVPNPGDDIYSYSDIFDEDTEIPTNKNNLDLQ